MKRMSPLRILVVDDNEDTAHIVRVICEIDGHEARVATSGAAALERLEQFDADVGVFDIAMPGMSGLELVAEIERRRPARMRYVALSGFVHESDRRRSLAAGFEEHLPKPVSIEELRAVLVAQAPSPVDA